MEYILKTHDLTKKYGETLAVNAVNMTIERGDIYGCVGENGAGKSTLIRLITGIAKPTRGSFQLFKQDRLGAVAAVVETPALHLSLSAEQNLAHQCRLLGLSKPQAKIKEILRTVGLDYLIGNKKRAKHFSLGMKQRLGIAMALISDPEFIVLDEPMNGLDPVGIMHMRELIKKLNEEKGITFFISSHILAELDKVATKYGFLSHGRLLKEISAEELRVSQEYIKLSFGRPVDKEIKGLLSGLDYEILRERSVIIRGESDINRLLKIFIDAGIVVSNVEVVSKGIEDYYLEIIGGKHA
ncbi:MAG: ABC transporter ATP-binding protein [Acholeplasmataceae bacterium]|jgi:ABC-2 type transport system ATP-binding protein|nr:ABC transporter ATP-binding protein [Acholeplasmataceae bacterium]